MEFDQLSRIRLLDPVKADACNSLIEECTDMSKTLQQLDKENAEIVDILRKKGAVLEGFRKRVHFQIIYIN